MRCRLEFYLALINIKLVKNNEAETSLTFHDINVLPVVEDNDEILTFDLTSGNTVVQNVDLKFETPKDFILPSSFNLSISSEISFGFIKGLGL